jgi:hypothetical protein
MPAVPLPAGLFSAFKPIYLLQHVRYICLSAVRGVGVLIHISDIHPLKVKLRGFKIVL